jgi:hypothetical protein
MNAITGHEFASVLAAPIPSQNPNDQIEVGLLENCCETPLPRRISKRMFTNHRAAVVVMVGCWIADVK